MSGTESDGLKAAVERVLAERAVEMVDPWPEERGTAKAYAALNYLAGEFVRREDDEAVNEFCYEYLRATIAELERLQAIHDQVK